MKNNYVIGSVIVALLMGSVFSVKSISAQSKHSPADTGRIKWGHTEFGNYSYPAMCDRAGVELLLYQSRSPKIDTSLRALLDSTAELEAIPENAKVAVKKCLAQFSPDQIPAEQLWGYLRSALLVGEDEKALQAVERTINEAKDSLMKDVAYSRAISSFFKNVPSRIDLAQRYIRRLDSLYVTPSPTAVNARLMLLSYWNKRYYKDSIRKYADEVISLTNKMDPSNRDLIDALSPYLILISMANDEGNMSDQQKYFDSMSNSLSDWQGGRGQMIAANTLQTIEHRRKIYNKKASPISEGIWFNTNGVQWPVPGRFSLIVLVDHTCGMLCWEQYKTIKSIKTIFGDDLHITLATPSAGYTIGSYVLDEKAEGDSIVNIFSKVYNMNYAVLLDPRPISKIPDGRVVRGTGPVAELFNDWNGITAILTDRNGRIQWTGSLSGNSSKRPIVATIQRLLKIEQ